MTHINDHTRFTRALHTRPTHHACFPRSSYVSHAHPTNHALLTTPTATAEPPFACRDGGAIERAEESGFAGAPRETCTAHHLDR